MLSRVVFLVLFLIAALLSALCYAQVPRDAQVYKRDLIREARAVWGLSAPSASFAAQIHQESLWNPHARSPVGALGLTQFMPATSKWISGLDPELSENAPLNPRWAMRAQIRYNKFLYDRVTGDNECERLAFAFTAYNGGLGWTLKRKLVAPKLGLSPNVCLGVTCNINPGITPANQRENQEYPHRILILHEPAYVLAGFGLGACESYRKK